MVGEGIRRVVVLGEGVNVLVVVSEGALSAAFVVGVGLNGVEEIGCPVEEAVVFLEPALVGMGGFGVAQMPFAGKAGCVARLLHYLAESDHVGFEKIAFAPWPESGEDRSPSCGTLCVVIELGKAHALCRELVDMRGIDFTAIAADVTPAHVVYHDEENVGAFGDAI